MESFWRSRGETSAYLAARVVERDLPINSTAVAHEDSRLRIFSFRYSIANVKDESRTQEQLSDEKTRKREQTALIFLILSSPVSTKRRERAYARHTPRPTLNRG
jgi:hypothetical protein